MTDLNIRQLMLGDPVTDPIRNRQLMAVKRARGEVAAQQARKQARISEAVQAAERRITAVTVHLSSKIEHIGQDQRHPGELLKELIVLSKLSQTQVACYAHISPHHVRSICDCDKDLNWTIAKRLSAFWGMLTADEWMALQMAYDKSKMHDHQDIQPFNVHLRHLAQKAAKE